MHFVELDERTVFQSTRVTRWTTGDGRWAGTQRTALIQRKNDPSICFYPVVSMTEAMHWSFPRVTRGGLGSSWMSGRHEPSCPSLECGEHGVDEALSRTAPSETVSAIQSRRPIPANPPRQKSPVSPAGKLPRIHCSFDVSRMHP